MPRALHASTLKITEFNEYTLPQNVLRHEYIYKLADDIKKKRGKTGGGSKKRRYVEGWMEFADKRMAKKVVAIFNNRPIGGKKRHNEYHDDLWLLKYLSGFKWENLTEKFLYERKMREHRLKAELAQGKKEMDFIVDKVEWSKRLQKQMDKSARSGEKIENTEKVEDEKEQTKKGEEEQKEEKPVRMIRSGLLSKRLRKFKQRLPIRPMKEIIDDKP